MSRNDAYLLGFIEGYNQGYDYADGQAGDHVYAGMVVALRAAADELVQRGHPQAAQLLAPQR